MLQAGGPSSYIEKINSEDYEMYDAIEIRLASEEYDDLEPIKVNWSLIDFNGKSASL